MSPWFDLNFPLNWSGLGSGLDFVQPRDESSLAELYDNLRN